MTLLQKTKPTRKELLMVLGRCQNLFGNVASASSDRNPNRDAQLNAISEIGFALCIEVLGYFDQVVPIGPWSDCLGDVRWKDAM